LTKYISGQGPIGAKLMILTDCPSYYDSEKLFTRESELEGILKDAKINRANCWLSAVSKFHIQPNDGPKKIPFAVRAKMSGVDIEQQLYELQNEINSIKPNCIIALSSSSLWALSGKTSIENYRGSIMHGMGVKFVPTYHPRDLSFNKGSEIKGYWNKQLILFDIKRAIYQSQFPELVLPQRTLQICHNSFELQQFIDRYKDYSQMAVDIEARGHCLPVCMGLAFTPKHGMTVPLWNKDGISTIPDADLVQIWIILAKLLYDKDIIGQNFNYDRDKIKRLGFIIRKLLSDIMLKAHAINPELPKRLSFNQSIYTEEPFYKDEGMYEGSMSDLLLGCARDSCVTIEINTNMDKDLDELEQRPFFENFLMKLPDVYWSIENQGFKMNPETRDKLIRKYVEWDEKIRYELFQLTGTEINVNSPKQIYILLFENFKLPPKPTTGEEDITALLNSPTAVKNPEHRRVLELILEGRRVRKSISTYLMALPDFDGRMRTTYFLCLETGRTSTGQQDPPIRPKVEVIDENGKKKDKVLGTAFQTMTKHGDIGADIREIYIPDEPDEIFVQADSAQAEARVVFLLANDEQALKDIDEHDYHALTASWFFGGTESDYSKKTLGYESPIRFAGKTLRHAGHLGAGKRRASIELNTQARKYKIPIAISEAIAERALIIFHSKQPKIQHIFQAGVIEALKKTRQLIAPVPYGVNALFGGKRTFYERWGDELFRQGFSYIPQRAVSDNTKAAAIRIREKIPGIKIVMESHDALLFCIKKDKLLEYSIIIKEEMERPINFSRCSLPRHELVIPCEIETGPNYRELSKFRDIPIIRPPIVPLNLPPKSITEQFIVVDLPIDSPLTNIIYNAEERKMNES